MLSEPSFLQMRHTSNLKTFPLLAQAQTVPGRKLAGCEPVGSAPGGQGGRVGGVPHCQLGAVAFVEEPTELAQVLGAVRARLRQRVLQAADAAPADAGDRQAGVLFRVEVFRCQDLRVPLGRHADRGLFTPLLQDRESGPAFVDRRVFFCWQLSLRITARKKSCEVKRTTDQFIFSRYNGKNLSDHDKQIVGKVVDGL